MYLCVKNIEASFQNVLLFCDFMYCVPLYLFSESCVVEQCGCGEPERESHCYAYCSHLHCEAQQVAYRKGDT